MYGTVSFVNTHLCLFIWIPSVPHRDGRDAFNRRHLFHGTVHNTNERNSCTLRSTVLSLNKLDPTPKHGKTNRFPNLALYRISYPLCICSLTPWTITSGWEKDKSAFKGVIIQDGGYSVRWATSASHREHCILTACWKRLTPKQKTRAQPKQVSAILIV